MSAAYEVLRGVSSAATAYGTYTTVAEESPISGFTCLEGKASEELVYIYRPTDTSKTYPLISWAHPWQRGGTKTSQVAERIGADIASAGYVVMAHTSAPVLYCWQSPD
jgi:hypothetical protein